MAAQSQTPKSTHFGTRHCTKDITYSVDARTSWKLRKTRCWKTPTANEYSSLDLLHSSAKRIHLFAHHLRRSPTLPALLRSAAAAHSRVGHILLLACILTALWRCICNFWHLRLLLLRLLVAG